MEKAKMKFTLVFLLLAAMCGTAYGQVTIGAGIKPVNGALLDLKENDSNGDVTATKGMMLPRVKLTEPDKLYPMFENATQPGTPAADYDDAAKKKAQDDIHTGLMVYNLGQCDGKFARGVYTWTGTEWIQLTKNPVLTGGGNPTLTFDPVLPAGNPAFIEIPSGQDARTLTAYTPSVSFARSSQVTGEWSNNIGGGLKFTANSLAPNGLATATTASPYTWSTSPISDISVFPDAMTVADLTSNPFLTRESKLTITGVAGVGPGNPCGGGTDQTQVITLNQTNYAIVPGRVASSTSLVVLRNTDQQSLNILSNVRWQAAEANPQGGTVPLANILDSYTTTSQGSKKDDGTFNQNSFDYTSVYPAGNNKYETTWVTFSDTEGRAKSVTLTVMQCMGSENPNSAGIVVANPVATSGTDTWGTSVVRHEGKPGVYEEFYSASFGPAGRWMSTNLTAWTYDSNSGVTVSLPAGVDVSSSTSDPRWCYPKPNAAITAGESAPAVWKSQHGLLYNWIAYTGNMNKTNNVDQGQIAGDVSGPNEVETLYGKIQGICPDGWHVPSDREWNQLEKEVYNNPGSYSVYSATELPFKSTYNPGVTANSDGTPQSGWRAEWETGSTAGATTNRPPSAIGGIGQRGADVNTDHIGHAQALVDVCNIEATAPHYGHSKTIIQGGFALFYSGQVSTGSTSSYGTNVILCSSSKNMGMLYSRNFAHQSEGIARSSYSSPGVFAVVRCKKD